MNTTKQQMVICDTCGKSYSITDLILSKISLVGYEKDKSWTSCIFCKKGSFIRKETDPHPGTKFSCL